MDCPAACLAPALVPAPAPHPTPCGGLPLSPTLKPACLPACLPPRLQITCAPSSAAQQEPLDLEAIEAQLRGVLLKLQYADSHLKRLPPGCTFEVVAYTLGRGGGSSGAGGVPQQAWAEEQPRPGHLELQQVGGGVGRQPPACLLPGWPAAQDQCGAPVTI